jgi:hypothetical protein
MLDDERVMRSDFSGHIERVSRPRPLSILPRRIWSDADWQRIQLGYSAQDMDEKWNVFAEGDVVFLHRSWTGLGAYEATFAPADGGGWQISQAVTAGERFRAIKRLISKRYRGDDEFDSVLLELVLSTIVLGESAQELRAKLVDLTEKSSGDTTAPPGLIEHSLLGERSDP